MPESLEWALLAYRLPREPSTPRIAVWRKLRRLGAVQLVDGLVALPATARNREQLDWIADEVVDAAGEAWTWTAVPGSREQQKMLASRMSAAAAEDYEAVLAEAEELAANGTPPRRSVERLRRELRRIDDRDHFKPEVRDRAHRAVRALDPDRVSDQEPSVR
jgi:hypothetical protein